MPAPLYAELDGFLNSLPWDGRPPKERFIQAAIGLILSGDLKIGSGNARNFAVTLASTGKSPLLSPREATELSDLNSLGDKSSAGTHTGTAKVPVVATKAIDYSDIKPGESPWINGLLSILRGRNEEAKTAIMSNIVAFAGYSAAAPEVPSGGVSLDAMQARIAAIEQQILDSEKKASVGGLTIAPKAGKGAQGKPGRK